MNSAPPTERIAIEVSFDAPRGPEAVWNIVADTDLLGRVMGDAHSVQTEAVERDDAARFLVKTRFFGLKVEFLERPTQFVHGRFFETHRVFPKGGAA